MEIAEYRRLLDRRLAEERAAQLAVRAERRALRQARRDARDAAQAQSALQDIAQQVQQRTHARIAEVVTHGLQTVFGPDAYEFRIEFERKRGKTEARLVFLRDAQEVDPLGAAGGGVVDVAAFVLRITCLLLARPARRRLLVLDEPLKMLSSDHIPAARELIETLSRDLGVQIIMVTHNRGLAAGQVIEVGEDVG